MLAYARQHRSTVISLGFRRLNTSRLRSCYNLIYMETGTARLAKAIETCFVSVQFVFFFKLSVQQVLEKKYETCIVRKTKRNERKKLSKIQRIVCNEMRK